MAFAPLSTAVKIFFSYAISEPRDRRLFEGLKAQLSILKRQHLIDEWYDSNISTDNNVTQIIETYLNSVDIIVLLISAEFFASDRCYELEMKRALELSRAGVAHLVPVILRPINWQASPLDQYSPLPPNGKPVSSWSHVDEALAEVAKGLRRVIDEITNRVTRRRLNSQPPQFPLYHFPRRQNAFFTDRKIVLDSLSSSFASGQSGKTTILTLNGLSGMGKTEIALEYIYLNSQRYQTILWLNASSRETLNSQIISVADQLSLPQKDRVDEQLLFAAVKRRLQGQTRWLLVLDHLGDVTLTDLIVPTHSSGHVLLTTHTRATETDISAFFIESMDTDDGALLLLHRAELIQTEERLEQAPAELVHHARSIVQAMGGFPLAIDQAAAYIKATGCGLAMYLTLYKEAKGRPMLLDQRGELTESYSHPESVTVTLSLIFKQVSQKRPISLNLLHLLAFLHPDNMPNELLEQGAVELDEPLQSLMAQPSTFYQALEDLHHFSLIQPLADATTFNIHRIVQAVIADSLLIDQQREWAIRVVRMVNYVFPEEVHFDTWFACERYLLQAQHCAKLITNFQLILREGAFLLQRLGSYCYQRANYADAEEYLNQALALHEQLQWADILETTQTLNALSLLFHRKAQYQHAELLQQQTLELREEGFGPDDLIMAESLHNLAMLYGNLDKYQQAEQLYQRALTLEESVRGAEHPEIARTLNNLALIYYYQGTYEQAEAAYQRALTIYDRFLAPNHPDRIYPLDGLGTIHERQGRYEQAQKFYQQALDISEQAFGAEHPDTAHSMNKLGDVAESLGDYQQARKLYQDALTIGEKVFGADHPDVALFLNNLAFVAHSQRQYQQAEPLYKRALSIYERALGPKHRLVASVLNNLGELYHDMGNKEQAELYHQRALSIREEVLGSTHPATAQSMNHLAELLHDQSKDEDQTQDDS